MAELLTEQQAHGEEPGPSVSTRPVWSSNLLTTLWDTMIGQKVIMAVTGLILVGFVIMHMIGNLKIFLGPDAINGYATFLRTMGEPMFPREALLWLARIILFVSVLLHVIAAVRLTLMNWRRGHSVMP